MIALKLKQLKQQRGIWHIYTYLKLGFPYEDGEKEFDEILHYIGRIREELFPVQKWGYVNDEEAFFINVNKNKYFVFARKE